MKVKIFCLTLVLGILFSSLAFGETGVRRGSMIVTPQLSIFGEKGGIFGIGGNFDYGFNRNFSFGGDVAFVTNETYDEGILVAPSLTYNFDIREANLDLFAGAGFYMFFYFNGDPKMRLNGFGGVRYFFSDKWAGSFKLIAGGSGFGGAAGVAYRLR